MDSFPTFRGTRRFNTEFTGALHLFLSFIQRIRSGPSLFRSFRNKFIFMVKGY
jgi:hypothetical protein